MKRFIATIVARSAVALAIVIISSAATLAQSGRVQSTPTPTPADDTVRITTEEIKLTVLAFDENGKFYSGDTLETRFQACSKAPRRRTVKASQEGTSLLALLPL